MELFVPFMLIILRVSGENPNDIEVIRHAALFADKELCEQAAKSVLSGPKFSDMSDTYSHRFQCVAAPQPAEYQDAFEVLKTQIRQRREQEQTQ